MLMGAAEVLSRMKNQIPGQVKFIFQPSEEGAPQNEEGGAKLMIKEGALDNPKPEAIFALHATASKHTGTINYRPNGAMASADTLHIVVHGKTTHGGMPWAGVDPIVVASQIVVGLQTITSRQIDLTKAPAVVTIASIHGGVRNNVIPDEVEMLGTIRALDPEVQKDIHQRVTRTVSNIAASAGVQATVTITPSVPVTFNDPQLTQRMLPTLIRVVGSTNIAQGSPSTVAEDFAFYQQRIPGLFVLLGVTPKGKDPATAAVNHSPHFFFDEAALPVGVRTLASLAYEFLVMERAD
jgi:amidohydrolase